MRRLPRRRRSETQRVIAFDQFLRFDGFAPDVIPEQEAVRMETHDEVTTAQRHHHLRG